MKLSLQMLLAGGSILAGLGSVGAAQATTPVTLNTAGVYDPGVIHVTGVENGDEYATAVEFGATIGSGAAAQMQTLYAFCVDLTHNIGVGFDTQAGHDIVSAHGDAQSTVNYAYHTSTLTADSVGSLSGQGGTALTNNQIGEIGGLANYGAQLIQTANPSAAGFDSQHLSNELAAVQGAIWSIEYPTSTFAASGEVGSLISQYIGQAPTWAVTGPVNAVYANDGSTQGFVVGVGTPEPASWALMMLGFGAAGASLRRRRPAYARIRG